MAIIAGIDPGSDNRTGFAIYDSSTQQILRLDSAHYSQAVQQVIAAAPACVVLENANINKNMAWIYKHFLMLKQQGGRKHDKEKSALNRCLKIAQDLGMNMLIAAEIARLLEAAGIPVAHVAPASRQRADKPHPHGRMLGIKAFNMPTKTTKKQFAMLCGYSEHKGNNEHSRDAGTLLIGKSLFYWQNYIKTQK